MMSTFGLEGFKINSRDHMWMLCHFPKAPGSVSSGKRVDVYAFYCLVLISTFL